MRATHREPVLSDLGLGSFWNMVVWNQQECQQEANWPIVLAACLVLGLAAQEIERMPTDERLNCERPFTNASDIVQGL